MKAKLRAQSLTIVAVIVLAGFFILLPPGARAALATHETDTDFNPDGTGGLLNGVEVLGTGAPANVQLLKDFPDWLEVFPTTLPSARSRQAMAWDEVNSEAILFGGNDGSAYLADTWRFNPVSRQWTNVTPVPSPSGRGDHGMAYDALRQVVVLHGGNDGSGGRRDTWEFNVNTDTWSLTSPLGPGPFAEPPLTYDSARGLIILADITVPGGAFQTWQYDAGSDTWTPRTGSSPPIPRQSHILAYFPSIDKSVLWGGYFMFDQYDDTYEYDYSSDSWTQTLTVGPGFRSDPAAVTRTAEGDVFLFGGLNGTMYMDDSWRYNYDLGFAAWDSFGTATIPPGRYAHAMAYAPASQEIVLFGGVGSGGTIGDSWLYTYTYRAGGLFRSNRVDAGSNAAVWNSFQWNLTPASQPAGTEIRFQLNIENNSNPVSFNFVGPDCTSGTYYTASPSVISSSCNRARYLWYLGVFATTDAGISPILHNITFDYDVPDVAPFVVDTSPFHTQGGWPVASPITVTFSEKMNTSSVTVETSPPRTFNHGWANGDTVLTATQTAPFLECEFYWVYVNGTDTTGNSLVPGPVANPFLFGTSCLPPRLVSTDPSAVQMNVLNQTIVITFTEDMNTTSVTVDITPGVGTVSQSWASFDTVLTLDHSAAFAACTWYTVNITNAQDESGAPLGMNPLVPNPWTFKTDCPEPYVINTVPAPQSSDVPMTLFIEIEFSEAMNQSSVSISSTPLLTGVVRSWPTSSTLHIDHNDFIPCKKYVITIPAARDIGGMAMLGPYEWYFVTDCGGPIILDTTPDNGTVGVPPNQVITVIFSHSMNTGGVTYTVNGGPWPFTVTWDPFSNIATYTYAGFWSICMSYTFEITGGTDQSGNPIFDPLDLNPFTFYTPCQDPVVQSTDPFDTEATVLTTRDVVVQFDKGMNTTVTTLETSPPTVFTSVVWTNGNMTLTGSHTIPFLECTNYTAWVNGSSEFGFPLRAGPAANPWTFTTRCPNPWVVSTDPLHTELNVALGRNVVITFIEAMNPLTVTVETSPPTVFAHTWAFGDTELTATHAPFISCVTYTAWVNGSDVDGFPLDPGPVPNPWTFSSQCVLAAPADLTVQRWGIGNADIRLDWTDVPLATVYHIYESQDRFAPFPVVWNRLLPDPTISEAVLAGHGSDGLTHYYVVRAQNPTSSESANSTMGVKTELQFGYNPATTNVNWFSLPYVSSYTTASDIANELGSTNVDLIGKWDAASQHAVYYFYSRGRWKGQDFPIASGDGLFLGVVQPFSWVVTGTDSVSSFGFVFNPAPARNDNWVGIPYTGIYDTASDIVAALEPGLGSTKISEVSLWDPATQTTVRFYWDGFSWTGVDFAISPGDGILIVIVSSFPWTPNLLTPPVP